MSLEARYDAFGERSDSLVPEAVWFFHRENDRWPLWHEALEELERFASVTSTEDALARLERAICEDEVSPKLPLAAASFFIAIDEDTADRIARRYIDRTMPRRDKEETW